MNLENPLNQAPEFPVPEEEKVEIVCAWCDKENSVERKYEGAEGKKVSHGICEKHNAEMRKFIPKR